MASVWGSACERDGHRRLWGEELKTLNWGEDILKQFLSQLIEFNYCFVF